MGVSGRSDAAENRGGEQRAEKHHRVAFVRVHLISPWLSVVDYISANAVLGDHGYGFQLILYILLKDPPESIPDTHAPSSRGRYSLLNAPTGGGGKMVSGKPTGGMAELEHPSVLI